MFTFWLGLILLAIPIPFTRSGENQHSSGDLLKSPFFWTDFARFSIGFSLVKTFLRSESNLLNLQNAVVPVFGKLDSSTLANLLLILPIILIIPHLFELRNEQRGKLYAPVSYCFAVALVLGDPIAGILAVVSAGMIGLSLKDSRWVLPALSVTYALANYVSGAGLVRILIPASLFTGPQLIAAFSYRRLIFR